MSSTSHSTLVPADSMIASAPHVRWPPMLQATIGNVPFWARDPSGGGVVPWHTSSIPPVPNVIFARPGSMHPWPASDACWSPTRAAIGGRPGSAVASATTPAVSTMVGSISSGTPSASHTPACQRPSATEYRPVTAAFEWSVTWTAPSDSVQATHVSTVPKHSSAGSRPAAALASNQPILVAD